MLTEATDIGIFLLNFTAFTPMNYSGPCPSLVKMFAILYQMYMRKFVVWVQALPDLQVSDLPKLTIVLFLMFRMKYFRINFLMSKNIKISEHKSVVP